MINIEDVIKRAKIAAGVKTNTELAAVFGISSSAITNWKAAGSANLEMIFNQLDTTSPSWILYGKGPMNLSDLDLLVEHKDNSKDGSISIKGLIAKNDDHSISVNDDNTKALIEQQKNYIEYLTEQNKQLLEKLLGK